MDNTSKYGSEYHASKKLQTILLEQMEENSELCDVSIVIGGVVQRAHWAVLISCPFFQALYNSGLKERREGKIVLQHGECAAMRSAIKFLYSGTINISLNNIEYLLDCAEYLQIEDLKQLCNSFLKSVELTVENCLRLTLLCSQYDLDYYTRAYRFFSGHLPEVLQQDAMLQLTTDSVWHLICDETLRYVPRKAFFEFLVAWTKRDFEDRGTHFAKLFCGIDVTRLDLEYLKERVLVDELVLTSSECLSAVNAEIECQTSLSDKNLHVNRMILTAGRRTVFRRPNSPGRFDVIYAYKPFDDEWEEFSRLPSGVLRPLFAFDSHIYLYVVSQWLYGVKSTHTSIHKLDVTKKTLSWDEKRIVLPRPSSVREIIWCSGRLFCVTSSESEVSSDQCQITISEIDESEGSCKRECLVFECPAETSMQSCCFIDRFICIKTHQSPTKFFIYDAQCSQLLGKSSENDDESMLGYTGADLLISGMGGRDADMYAIEQMCRCHKDDVPISQLPSHPERIDFSSVYYSGCFYIIGGKLPCNDESCDEFSVIGAAHDDRATPLRSVFKYDFEKVEWISLCELPTDLIVRGACIVKRPRILESCHEDCPHCHFQGSLGSSHTLADLQRAFLVSRISQSASVVGGYDSSDDDCYGYGYSYDDYYYDSD